MKRIALIACLTAFVLAFLPTEAAAQIEPVIVGGWHETGVVVAGGASWMPLKAGPLSAGVGAAAGVLTDRPDPASSRHRHFTTMVFVPIKLKLTRRLGVVGGYTWGRIYPPSERSHFPNYRGFLVGISIGG
jgi:hypothetical protein